MGNMGDDAIMTEQHLPIPIDTTQSVARMAHRVSGYHAGLAMNLRYPGESNGIFLRFSAQVASRWSMNCAK